MYGPYGATASTRYRWTGSLIVYILTRPPGTDLPPADRPMPIVGCIAYSVAAAPFRLTFAGCRTNSELRRRGLCLWTAIHFILFILLLATSLPPRFLLAAFCRHRTALWACKRRCGRHRALPASDSRYLYDTVCVTLPASPGLCSIYRSGMPRRSRKHVGALSTLTACHRATYLISNHLVGAMTLAAVCSR